MKYSLSLLGKHMLLFFVAVVFFLIWQVSKHTMNLKADKTVVCLHFTESPQYSLT